MGYASDDTIAAIATARGPGAVAIVRVSGPAAPAIAARLTGAMPVPRAATLATFRAADGERIDTGLALYFPAPASYTGEHVVELQCHGGDIVPDWLLEAVLAAGARPAEPGEFTLRAFLNDKLDLAQAEAVADLIGSGSRAAARAALRSLRGAFSARVTDAQAELSAIRVQTEAWLDFPDEELDRAALDALAARTRALGAALRVLLAEAGHGAALSDALRIAIAGRPNAGKSSLLNALAGYDAAIVTDVPGTTRDTLRERLTLDGLSVDVVDTAGIRDAGDAIEAEGVRRARDATAGADHVLWVADIRDGTADAVTAAIESLGPDSSVTIVLNKTDLAAGETFVRSDGALNFVALSALSGAGLPLLVEHLKQVAGFAPAGAGGAFTARRRHLVALEAAAGHVERAAREAAAEVAAEELRAAQAALGELTGELSSDDLLGQIFSSFCIGK